jgi:metal-sulfur cluster biosynthetic enzyme
MRIPQPFHTEHQVVAWPEEAAMTTQLPEVLHALHDVYDPCCREKGISVVDMGLVRSAERDDGGRLRVELLLTSGWCPFAARVLEEVQQRLEALPGVAGAEVEIVWDEAWSTDRLSPSARTKLRFLPEPAAVGDRDAYLAAHRPSPPPSPSTNPSRNQEVRRDR